MVGWVGWRQGCQMSDRTVCQEPIVGTQSCVGDGPLAEGVVDCLVVLPVVWIRCIIHSDLEILRAGEEEVTVVGELTRVAF
jgi:hypothetical protein